VRPALGADRNAPSREDAPDASGAGSAPTRKSGGDRFGLPRRPGPCNPGISSTGLAASREGGLTVPGVPRRLPTRPRRRGGDGSLHRQPRSSGAAGALAPTAGTLLERRAAQREATRTAAGPRERRRTRPQATACRLPDRPPPTPGRLNSSRESPRPPNWPSTTRPAEAEFPTGEPGFARSDPCGRSWFGAFACLTESLLSAPAGRNGQSAARRTFL
jgi:hypothetical protein